MTLREAKQAIRSFIRAFWDDQKLHEVYAFNADGKMEHDDPCGCIRGVTLAETLHTLDFTGMCPYGNGCLHYSQCCSGTAMYAEHGHLRIGYRTDADFNYEDEDRDSDLLRQRRMSAILRAELRRRARQSSPSEAAEPVAEVAVR